MIESLVSFLQVHIIPLGTVGVFFASVIEEVFAFIPSAFIMVFSGFLFLTDLSGVELFQILILQVALPISAGLTLGSLFIYGLCYFIGKPFVAGWGKWLGLSWDKIAKVEEKFARGPGDEIFMFITRAIPIFPSVAITSFAGLVRMPIRTYVVWTFVGTMVRSSFLAYVGYRVGELYIEYAKVVDYYENLILIFIAAAVLIFIFYNLIKNFMYRGARIK